MKKVIIGFILAGIILTAGFLIMQKPLSDLMKKLAVKGLNGSLNTEAQIDRLNVSLPRGIISFWGLRIKNPPGFGEKYFLTAESGYVDVGLRQLLSKKIVAEEIVLHKPRLNIEFNNTVNANAHLVFKKSPPAQSAAPQKRPQRGTSIRKVVIRDGIFKLTNYKVNPNGASALFDKIDITATPRKVDLSARLPAAGMQGKVKLTAEGNFVSEKISFDAALAAEEISLVYFMPFYINTAPVTAKSGRFDLVSTARCRNNQLYSLQKVDIEDLELVVNESSQNDTTVFGLPVLSVVNFFVNTNGRLTFEFEITGTLTDPQFHLGEALKKVLVKSIGDAILNRLSDISGKILDKVESSGKIGQAGKEAIQDILQKIIKPRQ